jgi:hypothetical protein
LGPNETKQFGSNTLKPTFKKFDLTGFWPLSSTLTTDLTRDKGFQVLIDGRSSQSAIRFESARGVEEMDSIKSCLAIAIIILASSFSLIAQEHTPRPPVVTPGPKPTTPVSPIDNGGWVRFTSELGRFSVLMPQMPGPKVSETTQGQYGPYTTHIFVVKAPPSIFLIGWVEYDPNFNFNGQAELEANRDNFVKGFNATLLDSRALTIDGYQAIEFIAETKDRRFKSRVYLVGRRPYQIVIGSPKDEDDSVSVNRFFNSFKVSPN